jgi:hypothetical protein
MSAQIVYGKIRDFSYATFAYQSDADHPGYNVLECNQHLIYKQNNENQLSIVVDWPTYKEYNAMALINHNIYTDFQNDDADGIHLWSKTYGASEHDNHIGTSGSPHEPTAADEPIWIETFDENAPNSVENNDYWALWINDPSTDLYIGTFLLGFHLDVDWYYNRPFTRDDRFGLRDWETSGGQRYSYSLHGQRRQWRIGWTSPFDTLKDDVVSFYDNIKGGQDFFVFQDYNSTLYYCRATSPLRLEETTEQMWNIYLDIEEVL